MDNNSHDLNTVENLSLFDSAYWSDPVSLATAAFWIIIGVGVGIGLVSGVGI